MIKYLVKRGNTICGVHDGSYTYIAHETEESAKVAIHELTKDNPKETYYISEIKIVDYTEEQIKEFFNIYRAR